NAGDMPVLAENELLAFLRMLFGDLSRCGVVFFAQPRGDSRRLADDATRREHARRAEPEIRRAHVPPDGEEVLDVPRVKRSQRDAVRQRSPFLEVGGVRRNVGTLIALQKSTGKVQV